MDNTYEQKYMIATSASELSAKEKFQNRINRLLLRVIMNFKFKVEAFTD